MWISWVIDLKSKTANYFTTKIGLFRNSKRIRILDKQAITKAISKSCEQRRRTFGWGWEVEGCYKHKVHWSKLGVWNVLDFHWLSCDFVSWPGLLPGKEKSLLPPAGIVDWASFFLLGSAKDCNKWYGMRAPLSGQPTPL